MLYIVIKQEQYGSWEIHIEVTHIEAFNTVDEACAKVDELSEKEDSHKIDYTYVEVPFNGA